MNGDYQNAVAVLFLQGEKPFCALMLFYFSSSHFIVEKKY